jgi:hypothetical protein
MQIRGKNALVLGGAGLVGMSVCRELLRHEPRTLAVAARRRGRAQEAAGQLQAEFPGVGTRILAAWGDVFMRAEWQVGDAAARDEVLADTAKRRRLISDILDPLDDDIVRASMLAQMILGVAREPSGWPAGIVVDCMNTATAVSYQNVYGLARHVAELASAGAPAGDWPEDVERLLASLYVPQLVRHVQLLHEAMRRAGTEAYVKVSTSGTGGMGFNIPYTHGEERPSRLLLSKAALAGAQTLLTFLMARTPDGPQIVREIKPTALIGWREIGHGPIRPAGRSLALHDCPPEAAVSARDPAKLLVKGDFGVSTGQDLEGVYIDTGENGRFSAAEFAAITALGQMQLVTPEEVAQAVVQEVLRGGTGRDVVAALDGAVMGPSFRAGYLREAALNRLRELEAEHGEAIAFEILGPPRLSKLLYEAYLIKRVCQTMDAALAQEPRALAARLEQEVVNDRDLRRRIVSIGIAILLADGERLLRGPVLKSQDAHHGWVDLTADNMLRWQRRLSAIRDQVRMELAGDTSSRYDRVFTASREWLGRADLFDIGEIAAWIFVHEERGQRMKG